MSTPSIALPASWSSRLYRSGDEEHILDALLAAFTRWPRIDIDVPAVEHLRWKLSSHPAALQHHMIAELDGAIASTRMLLVQPVRLFGQPQLAFQPVDLAVAPAFQGRGVAQRLLNIERRRIRQKAYKELFGLKLYIRSWHPAMRNLRERQGASGYAFGNRMIALERPNAAPSAPITQPPCTLRQVAAFDERIDAFWREASRPFAFAIDRTINYLNWRYTDRRAGTFTTTLAEDAGRLLGYTITRTSRDVGYIVDLLALPGRRDVAYALASDALVSFARTGTATIECWLPIRHAYQPLLRDLGFARGPRTVRFRFAPVGATKDQLAPLRKIDTPLHLTAGDTDLV